MTCDNTPTRCSECGRRVCGRCGRCYTRHPGFAPGDWVHECPSRRCRWLKRLPFTRGSA